MLNRCSALSVLRIQLYFTVVRLSHVHCILIEPVNSHFRMKQYCVSNNKQQQLCEMAGQVVVWQGRAGQGRQRHMY